MVLRSLLPRDGLPNKVLTPQAYAFLGTPGQVIVPAPHAGPFSDSSCPVIITHRGSAIQE